MSDRLHREIVELQDVLQKALAERDRLRERLLAVHRNIGDLWEEGTIDGDQHERVTGEKSVASYHQDSLDIRQLREERDAMRDVVAAARNYRSLCMGMEASYDDVEAAENALDNALDAAKEPAMASDREAWRDYVGVAVTCTTCGQRKAPRGRSAPMAAALCDWDCPGYCEAPLPGSLWPGETGDDFGYPCTQAGDGE